MQALWRGWVVGAAVTLLLLPITGWAQASSIGYEIRWVANTRANVITANLNDKQIKVAAVLARGGVGRSESFRSMVGRARPDAAITGTFFGTTCLIPTGDLVVDGSFLHLGRAGTGLAITPDNAALLVPRQVGRKTDWAGYDTVICGGPSLVRGGKIAVDPRAEGFTSGAHFSLAPRTAVGITKYNKLLLVAVGKGIHLSRMAKVMKELGAVEAISLDGGTSTALSYGPSLIFNPGRRLTNVLAVYATHEKYAKAMGLTPVSVTQNTGSDGRGS